MRFKIIANLSCNIFLKKLQFTPYIELLASQIIENRLVPELCKGAKIESGQFHCLQSKVIQCAGAFDYSQDMVIMTARRI
ncbi:MAG: hypothetical protein PHF25_04610 [Candidatus Margulisbacteria bacterium]|nr:hypothetical protein [Candidatus Margulisiibacteriota bacterium]